jgi:hypothetical protein
MPYSFAGPRSSVRGSAIWFSKYRICLQLDKYRGCFTLIILACYNINDHASQERAGTNVGLDCVVGPDPVTTSLPGFGSGPNRLLYLPVKNCWLLRTITCINA